jgi:hypothetical protein
MMMADSIGEPNSRSPRILRDLADALGCSVEAFRDETKPPDIAMTQELLSLWMSITDTGVRERILESLRAAQREADKTPA